MPKTTEPKDDLPSDLDEALNREVQLAEDVRSDMKRIATEAFADGVRPLLSETEQKLIASLESAAQATENLVRVIRTPLVDVQRAVSEVAAMVDAIPHNIQDMLHAATEMQLSRVAAVDERVASLTEHIAHVQRAVGDLGDRVRELALADARRAQEAQQSLEVLSRSFMEALHESEQRSRQETECAHHEILGVVRNHDASITQVLSQGIQSFQRDVAALPNVLSLYPPLHEAFARAVDPALETVATSVNQLTANVRTASEDISKLKGAQTRLTWMMAGLGAVLVTLATWIAFRGL